MGGGILGGGVSGLGGDWVGGQGSRSAGYRRWWGWGSGVWGMVGLRVGFLGSIQYNRHVATILAASFFIWPIYPKLHEMKNEKNRPLHSLNPPIGSVEFYDTEVLILKSYWTFFWRVPCRKIRERFHSDDLDVLIRVDPFQG